MSLALRHIGIVVSNLEKALAIYRDFLGCEVVSSYKGLAGNYQDKLVGLKNVKMNVTILKTFDNNRIELLEYLSHPGKKRSPVLSNDIGCSHFAISVDNLDILYNSRKNYDVSFISRPLVSKDGFVKVAYAILMDECIVELVQVLDDRAKFSGGE
tara:strand:- start:2671 stop:3135 length:465 start_codon:yes stop_codon:yes gene_type:complete